MQKKVAILLSVEVYNDYRVVKVINTLSKTAIVHLFYINGVPERDKSLFNNQVQLFSINHRANFFVKFLRHTFFCYEFNFFKKEVLSKQNNYDYVWANDLPTLLPAWKICKKLNSKLIYDSHEIYLETINQFFPIKTTLPRKIIFSFFTFLMKWHGLNVERKLIKRTAVFVTVNNTLLDYFQQKYKIPKGIVIMNLPKIGDVEKDIIDYRKIYSWTAEDFIFLYQGTLNEGRGLFLIIDAIKLLKDKIKLIILGDGSLKAALIKRVEECGLSGRIKFIEKIALSQLPGYTSGADIGVNLLEDINLSKKLASPNKLFEYIHANTPVLATNTIENRIVFEKYKIGLLCKNNSSSVAEAMLELKNTNLNLFKENCSKAAMEYNWESQESKLLDVLKSN